MIIEKKLTKNRREIKNGQNIPEFIIIHHTGSGNSTIDSILRYFRLVDSVSVHYIVGRNGEVVQYVDERDVAFHAGTSKWGSLTDLNKHSIGIEVVSDGSDFTEKQRTTTQELCRMIMDRHNIRRENVLRHADIALPAGRKWDIGPNFFKPWESWEGFQASLNGGSTYHKEIDSAIEWVKARGISNGERPSDSITRAEMFVLLRRLWLKIKGLE